LAKSSYRILLATVGAASLALPDFAAAQKVGAAAAGGSESRDGGGESQTEAIFLFGDRMCVKVSDQLQCTTNFNTAIIGLRGQPPSAPTPVTTETIQGLIGGLQGSNQGALTDSGTSQGAPPSVVALPSTGGSPPVVAPTATAQNFVRTVSPPPPPPPPLPPPPPPLGAVRGGTSLAVSGNVTGGSTWQQQGQANWSSLPPLSPPPPSNGIVTTSGSANHGYERYVISGTIEGGWQWQGQTQGAAGNQSHGQTSVHGVATGADRSHFVGSLNRFTSGVQTWWKSRSPLWAGNRGHGQRAAHVTNNSAKHSGRRGK
jgi:hypothetical protein